MYRNVVCLALFGKRGVIKISVAREERSVQTRGVVVIATYKRAQLLRKCLLSLYDAVDSNQLEKVLIVQDGSAEVLNIAKSFVDDRTHLIQVPRRSDSPLVNINLNYLDGFRMAFSDLHADWVLSLEEDSVISSDALVFIDAMYRKYVGNKSFRGVNLGSLECDVAYASTYSLLRYGLHGGAGMFSRRTWDAIGKWGLIRNIDRRGFDSQVEHYLKSGFMVTPNLSKSMNYGWIEGTHVHLTHDTEPFFQAMEKSWSMTCSSSIFRQLDVIHSWREDIQIFTRSASPVAWSRFLMLQLIRKILR